MFDVGQLVFFSFFFFIWISMFWIRDLDFREWEIENLSSCIGFRMCHRPSQANLNKAKSIHLWMWYNLISVCCEWVWVRANAFSRVFTHFVVSASLELSNISLPTSIIHSSSVESAHSACACAPAPKVQHIKHCVSVCAWNICGENSTLKQYKYISTIYRR